MSEQTFRGWTIAKRILGPCLMLAIFAGAMWLLHKKLGEHSYQEVLDKLRLIPWECLAGAILLTVANYTVLVSYDWLAVRAIGHPLPLRRVAMAAIVGYATSYTFGTLIGGNAVRFRLYSSWGLTALEVLRLIALLGLIFWLGVFALAGVIFVWQPLEVPVELRELGVPLSTVRPLGIALLAIVAVYFSICLLWRKPIHFRGRDYRLPTVTSSAIQVLVASIDMTVAAAVLYVLLPKSLAISYPHFLAMYLLGLVAVVFTHVPVGLFEIVIVALSEPILPEHEIPTLYASLLIYRVLYFLLPFVISAVWMGIYEVKRICWPVAND